MMNRRPENETWVIAGGGTGGHVTPALALGEELLRQGRRVLFVGSEGGLEHRLVPEAGFELVSLPARQFMGQSPMHQLLAAIALLPTTWRAIGILRKAHTRQVISVGGYAALPCVLAATLLRIPLALVEPNAIPGRVTRLAARLANHVFLGFESAVARLGATTTEVHVTGIPVRKTMTDSYRSPKPPRNPDAPLHLLIFGGSQGARQINNAMLEALPHLDPSWLQIFHQTGDSDFRRVREAYDRAGFEAKVVVFESNMAERYHWADLALCRAGALTIAELTLAQLGALLVPYPFAADDHQRANALEISQAGAGLLLSSAQLSGRELARVIESFVRDPSKISRMGAKAGALAHSNAVEQIIAICRKGLGEEFQPALFRSQPRHSSQKVAFHVQE